MFKVLPLLNNDSRTNLTMVFTKCKTSWNNWAMWPSQMLVSNNPSKPNNFDRQKDGKIVIIDVLLLEDEHLQSGSGTEI